jgi:hypothetical protein
MFVDFNILNQLGSPSINSNTFANRPSAGQVGRLFVSTDTFEIYRDTGTGWDLIGGPGSSTVTGSGAAGQVTYWTGSNSVSGENNLWWDAASNHLGINTITPGAALDIHSAADVGMQLNGTGATPNIYIDFLQTGTSQYRLGYTDGTTDYQRFSVYDVTGAKEVLTIDKQSRYVGINFQYSSLADQPAYTLDVSGQIRGQNLLVNSSGQTHLISNLYVAPADGQNIFIGNGGQSISYTTGFTGSYNTSIGFNSLLQITTGFRNTALGHVALMELLTGSGNVAVGDNAGRFFGTLNTDVLTNSTGSIFIGEATKALLNNSSNEIVIGYATQGLGNNTIKLGNNSSTLLQTSAVVNAASYVPTSSTIPSNGMYLPSTNQIGFATNSVAQMYLNSTGLGIGTNMPLRKLHVVSGVGTGQIQSTSTSSNLYFADTNSTIIDNQGIGSIGNDIYVTTGGLGRIRIKDNGNLLIGGTTDNGYRFQVYGNGYYFNGNVGSSKMIIYSDYSGGSVGFSMFNTTGTATIDVNGNAGNISGIGNITTGAPTGGTAAPWKLGSRVAATVVVNTTEYIELDVGGTLYKLATVT